MEIKRLCVPFEVKQLDEENELYFQFSGYAATFNNIDRGNDKILPGAFTKTLGAIMAQPKEKKLPVMWQHDPDMPLGIFTKIEEDIKGLYVEGRMPKTDTFVSGRVIPQMKSGSIDSMSIGYSTIDADMDGSIRHLKEISLFEISFVTIPMNTQAEILDMKNSRMDVRQLEAQLRRLGYSNSLAKKHALAAKADGICREVGSPQREVEKVSPAGIMDELNKIKSIYQK